MSDPYGSLGYGRDVSRQSLLRGPNSYSSHTLHPQAPRYYPPVRHRDEISSYPRDPYARSPSADLPCQQRVYDDPCRQSSGYPQLVPAHSVAPPTRSVHYPHQPDNQIASGYRDENPAIPYLESYEERHQVKTEPMMHWNEPDAAIDLMSLPVTVPSVDFQFSKPKHAVAYVRNDDGTYPQRDRAPAKGASSQVNSENSKLVDDWSFVVKISGLPWSASDEDITRFFGDECPITKGSNGIHRVLNQEGRFSGDVFVELQTEESLHLALTKDKKFIGRRTVTVSASSVEELKEEKERMKDVGEDPIVKMRGLPYKVSREEIAQFFAGYPIRPNGIYFVPDPTGRGTCNGEAFVEFVDNATAGRSIEKNKDKIGSRWVEIFRSCRHDLENVTLYELPPTRHGSGYGPTVSVRGRPSPYSRPLSVAPGRRAPMVQSENDLQGFHDNRRGGHSQLSTRLELVMRGLPFDVTEQEIHKFFHPIKLARLRISRDRSGKVQDSPVEFFSIRDFGEAKERHRQSIRHRYVEIIDERNPRFSF